MVESKYLFCADKEYDCNDRKKCSTYMITFIPILTIRFISEFILSYFTLYVELILIIYMQVKNTFFTVKVTSDEKHFQFFFFFSKGLS